MKNPTNCIIIDDDPTAVDLLIEYINEVPRLKLTEVYYDSVLALSELLHLQESFILFVDIHMPKFSGLQLAEKLKHKAMQVIFTTGDDQQAINAFKVNAKKYLLKPFELPSFVEAVSDVLMLPLATGMPDKQTEVYFARTGERGKVTRIKRSEIILVQSMLNYVTIATENQSYIVYMTMKEMTEKLPETAGFFRIHKSFLINTDYVSMVVGNTVMVDKHEVVMSGNYKKSFVKYIERNTLLSKRITDK